MWHDFIQFNFTEHRTDLLHDRLIAHELDAHHRSDRSPGDVVLGGPQPAAADDGIGTLERVVENGNHPVVVVTDLGLVV